MIELLVVIVIVATLAVLIFTLSGRARMSAARVAAVNQMRGIGMAAASWASDRGRIEPFYFANGTGDFPHESAAGGSKFTPGNPAKALWNKEDPDSGYVRSPDEFFSPLTRSTPPSRHDYDPAAASTNRIWGTYGWFHPYITAASRGSRYPEISGTFPDKVNRTVEGRYMMSESYAFSEPRFGKKIYHALLTDGSVQAVAESEEDYNRWKAGN